VPVAPVVRTQTHFCLDEHTFGLVRLDGPGAGVVVVSDAGMSVRTDIGGVYALFDEAAPTLAVSAPLFFARQVAVPLLELPRACTEVHRLTTNVWACDGQLVGGGSPLGGRSASRWMRRIDGTILAARDDGIALVAEAELGTDAGKILWTLTNIEAWASDDGGLSVATDAGFLECLWGEPGCSSLGPRFGTGDVPLAQQTLFAFLRKDGQTLFSMSPAASPWCEARVAIQRCSSAVLGGIVASHGDSAWAGSTVSDGTSSAIIAMTWDAGWVQANAGFVGPPNFVVQVGARGEIPIRVIYGGEGQVLFWRWDAPQEAFEFVEMPDAGAGSLWAGAEPGFFWVSVSLPVPTTRIYEEMP
jgi:hypothetical protein